MVRRGRESHLDLRRKIAFIRIRVIRVFQTQLCCELVRASFSTGRSYIIGAQKRRVCDSDQVSNGILDCHCHVKIVHFLNIGNYTKGHFDGCFVKIVADIGISMSSISIIEGVWTRAFDGDACDINNGILANVQTHLRFPITAGAATAVQISVLILVVIGMLIVSIILILVVVVVWIVSIVLILVVVVVLILVVAVVSVVIVVIACVMVAVVVFVIVPIATVVVIWTIVVLSPHSWNKCKQKKGPRRHDCHGGNERWILY